jgi:hypothetical protein
MGIWPETQGFRNTTLIMGLFMLSALPGTWYWLRMPEVAAKEPAKDQETYGSSRRSAAAKRGRPAVDSHGISLQSSLLDNSAYL